MATQMLSDKGLSILTFAAYHELTSGEHVSEVACGMVRDTMPIPKGFGRSRLSVSPPLMETRRC